MKKILILILTFNLITIFVQGKEKIAVYGFKGENKQVNEKVKNIIERELINQNKFDVLSKKTVFQEVWQEEASLGIDKIGTEFQGVDFLFSGEVQEIKNAYSFNYKIINVSNSKIIISDSVDFKYDNIKYLGIYFQKKLLEKFPVTGRIIDKDGGKVYINIGKVYGIKNGSIIKIFRSEKEILDEETNEMIYLDKKNIAEAKVDTVENKYSSATIDGGILTNIKVKKDDLIQVKSFTELEISNKGEKPKKSDKSYIKDIKGKYPIKVGKVEKTKVIPSGLYSISVDYLEEASLDFRIGILDFFEFGIGGVFDDLDNKNNNEINFNIKSSIEKPYITTGLKYELGTEKNSQLTLLAEKKINKLSLNLNGMYSVDLNDNEDSNVFGLAIEYLPKFTDRFVPAVEYINYGAKDDILVKFDFELKRSLWFGLGKNIGEEGNYYFRIEKNGIFVR
ncbi:MAG: hypothetical protein ACQERZ_00225 [Fusobacteriota bacterium]